MRALLFLTFIVSSVAIAADKPNVLFIAVDDLKPLLGCYGRSDGEITRDRSFGSARNRFHEVLLPMARLWPTRASLMTSLRPEAVGVIDLKTDLRAKNPQVLTLPQYFMANGYATAGCGKIYDPRCVDNKRDCDTPSWSLPFITPRVEGGESGVGESGDGAAVVGAPECDDEAQMDGQIALAGVSLLKKLAADKSKPFFLAVGFKKPHLPFVAPKKYWDLYRREQFVLAPYQGGIRNDSGYVLHDSPEFRSYGGVPKQGEIPAETQRECLHGYYACVSFIDAQIGKLTRQLEALGLADNTLIVLWGDHGFHLGDHHMWGKHSTLEAAARAPLIIVPAGGSAGHSNSTPVEFTDIFPTLCTLAKLPVPAQLQGRTLEPLLMGKADSVREGALTVFKSKGAMGYSYRTDRYRYTEWVNKFGKTIATDLFDYLTDPMEQNNMDPNEPDHSELVQRLSAALRRDAQGCDRLFGK